MKNVVRVLSLSVVALLGAGLVLSGCKTAPDLTSADAQKLIQAKYDQTAAAPVSVTVDDTGMQQGFAAKYWTRTKQYPNKYWADFTLTDEGKKAIKLSTGKDVIEWRPLSATDKTFSVVVMTAAANHLKARDVKDPQDDVNGAKTVIFNEAVDLTGVPDALANIAHNPGNKLSSKKTATFVVDNGAWKLQSIN
ncbi:MAG: hypothetical protein WCE75_00430 [Terracidiphilus sp.]